MKRAIAGTILTVLMICGWLAFGQATDTSPKFLFADVHPSLKKPNQFSMPPAVRNGRYELTNATMADLIRAAYSYDADKILGGSNWLEMDRFDIIAKAPEDSTPETHKQMLQALLEDRFKLVVHKENKPLPTYALVVGKKPQIKEADGTGETGCHLQTGGSGTPAEGGVRIMFSNNGVVTTLSLGPGGVLEYNCRNMTMAAFAGGLRGMMGVGTAVGTNPVMDETGLKGMWNFDVRWSLGIIGPNMNSSDKITVFDAVDKQLGLKLEERHVPTPVIVVESVSQKPSPNPPGVAEALPEIAPATEFEVASVKPSDPNMRGGRFQMQPGGRLLCEGMNMRFLVGRAFNTNSADQLAGLPKWADSDRFDVIAKAPPAGLPIQLNGDTSYLAPMIRSLLETRFGMKYHQEERPVTAYSLVAAKPKMKKADPASRSWCKYLAAPPGTPPGSQVFSCQNITMEQFADRLQFMSQELSWPVMDVTEITGGWDFSFTYSRMAGIAMQARAVGDAGAAGANMPAASDPTGALSLFEALEKQVGLKLEMHKRPAPMFVIDHLEEKPTDN